MCFGEAQHFADAFPRSIFVAVAAAVYGRLGLSKYGLLSK
jgi:hypothetical protein